MDQEPGRLACPNCGTQVSTWRIMLHTKFRCENCKTHLKATGFLGATFFTEVMIYPFMLISIIILQNHFVMMICAIPILYLLLAYGSAKLFYRLQPVKR